MSNPRAYVPALLSTLLLTSALGAAPTSSDIDAQYHAVLVQMKHPAASGILVTEIEADSPAGAAGLQAGDIIYHFAGADVHDLPTLRQQLADAFAQHISENNDDKVLLAVHRLTTDGTSTENKIFQVPRAPLGIRAIEVEAAVPATPNPPPSPRGSITLDWSASQQQLSPDPAANTVFLRTTEATTHAPFDWQRRTLTPAADALLATVEIHRVDPEDPALATVSTDAVTFRLRTGDYKTAPAFLLDSLHVIRTTADGSTIATTAQRAGAQLRTNTTTVWNNRTLAPASQEVPLPLAAIPDAAIPLLAAAMPQEKDAALQLHLLSIHDFLARPGYLLIARGKHPIDKIPNASRLWQVDLLHCGVTLETYWLSDQRQLLQIDYPGATHLTARHVASQEEATIPATPSTQSTTTSKAIGK